MADRPVIDVESPSGGWGAPWPNVAEIEAVLPHHLWTLVGGLMAQLYAIHLGVDAVRPTNDVDIVLHVETTRGVVSETARALESLGYVFVPSIDDRNAIAHRFVRGEFNARLSIHPGRTTTISIPSPLGALVLKAAAYRTDSRDRDRHLQDATLLLSVMEDPYDDREHLAGSDRSRLLGLVSALPDDSPIWWSVPAEWRSAGQTALRILTA